MALQFDDIKDRYEISLYIESEAGISPDFHRGHVKTYCCPFHSEDSPSFEVNTQTQTWRCWGACNERGDIADYVQMRMFGKVEVGPMRKNANGSIDESDHQYQAYMVLDGKKPAEFLPRIYSREDAIEPKHIPTMEDVMSYREHRELAVGYFASRGINAGEVDGNLVGTQVKYAWPYVFKTGAETGQKIWFEGRRHAMPYMVGKQVRCINKRRDDVWAAAVMDTQSKTMDAIRQDMWQRSQELFKQRPGYMEAYENPEDIPTSKLLDRCFGPRFHKDGSYPIYGFNSLCHLDENGEIIMVNGRPSLRRMMRCLIVEGEADRLSAEQCGFTAIAAKAETVIQIGGQRLHGAAVGKYFRAMLTGVRDPIVIADNDKNGAGLQYAESMLQMLGRGSIIVPPSPFKDLNDLLKAGELECWLLSKGIRPQPTQEVAF